MATDKSIAELGVRLDRIEAALSALRSPQGFDWGSHPIPWPNPGDPVPIDIARLTRAQLQLTLESIKAQRIRLDAIDNMIQQQLKQPTG